MICQRYISAATAGLLKVNNKFLNRLLLLSSERHLTTSSGPPPTHPHTCSHCFSPSSDCLLKRKISVRSNLKMEMEAARKPNSKSTIQFWNCSAHRVRGWINITKKNAKQFKTQFLLRVSLRLRLNSGNSIIFIFFFSLLASQYEKYSLTKTEKYNWKNDGIMLTALRQRRIVGSDTVGGVCLRQDEATFGLCDISTTKNLRNSRENV